MRTDDLDALLTAHGFVGTAWDAWRREGPPTVVVRLRKGTRADVAVDGLAPVRVRTDDPADVVAVIDRLGGPVGDPPDTLPVPVDAWNRMLAQLGNLHAAGEEVASARERAAIAETKVAFLKQQLAARRRTRDSGLFGSFFGRG